MPEGQIIAGVIIGLLIIIMGRRAKTDGKVNLIKNVTLHEEKKSKTIMEVMGAPIKNLVSRANDRLRKRRESNGKDSSGLGDAD